MKTQPTGVGGMSRQQWVALLIIDRIPTITPTGLALELTANLSVPADRPIMREGAAATAASLIRRGLVGRFKQRGLVCYRTTDDGARHAKTAPARYRVEVEA